MSLSIPSRRVLATASSACTASSTTTPTAVVALALRPRIQHGQTPTQNAIPNARLLHTTARRPVDWGRLFGRKKKAPSTPSDVAGGFAKELSNHQTRQELRERMTNSGLDESPLLAGEMEEAGGKDAIKATEKAAPGHRSRIGTSLLRADLQRAIDPDPRSRVRWERKMVVRQVGRMLDPAGRETKAERLARTERELLHQSTPLPTSTKKLMYLARQIAGKTLEDALVQMRFSKKKMAKEVIWLLEEARDMAIVERGMGLGNTAGGGAAVKETTGQSADTGGAKPSSAEPLRIRTKDGRWLTITDPSRIYIDQAWVGKGEWRSSSVDYRARGRRFIKWSPSAFLSVVLKEEKTRVRLHEERVAKEARKTPWVHLPNRPVTAQRPYYSW